MTSFLQAVEQAYAFLFADFAFRAIHQEEARQGEHLMVVLESDRARIKIELEQGTPVVYFGALDAPITWSDRIDGVTNWFVDNALLNFIEHRIGVARPAFDHPSEPPTTDRLLSDGAARLRPHVAELIAAFAPERPHEWWRAFDAYQAERSRQMRAHRNA